ncbi:MAG: VOC family protein [Henriciella sp.]
MRPMQYYPLIQTEDVVGTSSFYQRHFGFRPMFESDWYVHLQSVAEPSVNLAVLKHDHETIPAEARGVTQGVILTFEVEDVDAEDARLRAEGVSVVSKLRSEDHGQRHAIYRDPNGIMIDVITPIPPAPEFQADYAAEALPA